MSDCLIHGGLALTGEAGDEPRIADILVRDGRIVSVAPAISADCERIDATGCIVMPGMIDASRHTWQTLTRGICGDLSGAGYWTAIRHQAARCLTPDDFKLGNLAGMLEAIDAGVTSVFDFSNSIASDDHADALLEGTREAGIRCRFAPAMNSVPGESKAFAEHGGRLKLLERLRRGPLTSDDALVTLAAGLSDIPIVGIDAISREIAACRSLGLRMTLNCEAFPSGSEYGELELMEGAGLLGPDLLFVHMALATGAQLERVRDTGGSVVICPETMMALFHRLPPTLRVFCAGLKPALGSDITSGWSADMFSQARIALQAGRVEAATLGEDAKPESSFRDWPTSRMMFDAITNWGAAAIGLPDQIGSLVPGKRADIVVLRANSINMAPVNDPFSTVILQSNPGNVDTVLIDGVARKRAGKLLFDTEALQCSIAKAHGRFVERLEKIGGWLPAPGETPATDAYRSIDHSA